MSKMTDYFVIGVTGRTLPSMMRRVNFLSSMRIPKRRREETKSEKCIPIRKVSILFVRRSRRPPQTKTNHHTKLSSERITMLSHQSSRAMRHLTLRLSQRALSTLPGRGAMGGSGSSQTGVSTSLRVPSYRFQSTAAVEQPREPQVAPREKAAPTPFVPSADRQYEFFQNVEITSEGVAVIRFDNLTKPVNTISFALANEAKKLWAKEIESNHAVKAVVFTSAKPNMFIAGADIFDIQSMEDKSQLTSIIADGLAFFQQMRKKGVPLVAAIDGPALGGGLEWALWCDYRICTDNPKTKVSVHPSAYPLGSMNCKYRS